MCEYIIVESWNCSDVVPDLAGGSKVGVSYYIRKCNVKVGCKIRKFIFLKP